MKSDDSKGYYAILGVSSNADAAAIKAAFRQRAMDLHPDRNDSPDATRQFQLLNEAYVVLSDPESRAQYDTNFTNANQRSTTPPKEPPVPIVCSCCGKVTAQPRYAIFYEVKSFIVFTRRSVIQGIFCSVCAEKKALKASAVTWLLGWWGFPWGLIYSIEAIFTNMFGGKRPNDINARLAAYQAWVFATLGKTDMARAVAQDALALAQQEVNEENTKLRQQIGELVAALGDNVKPMQLRNAWALFRRPFFVQGLLSLSVIGLVYFGIQNDKLSANPSRGGSHAATSQTFRSPKPSYTRPMRAPNGEPWPVFADYVSGYPRIHANGLSNVTIDNSQNDSDVFAKVVSQSGNSFFPVRTLFIPAHGRFSVANLTAGIYDVRYQDLNSGYLSRSEVFTLEETPTYDGTRYSELTMTLYKVRNGNMQTYAISEAEF